MERFGVRDFFFWAETFVIDRQHVAELCQAMLDANLGISWTCNSRIDIVDEKLLKLMARAGCWMISYGIESADQQVLDAVRKGTRVEQAAAAVSLARAAGLKTAGHFIFGLPGDTEEAMQKTLKLARSLRLDVAQFYSAVPFPGSALYEQALEQGWIETTDFAGFSQNSSVMRTSRPVAGNSKPLPRCGIPPVLFQSPYLAADTAHVRMAGIKKHVLCSRRYFCAGGNKVGMGQGSGCRVLTSDKAIIFYYDHDNPHHCRNRIRDFMACRATACHS